MDNRIVFGVLITAIVSSQSTWAQTTSVTDDQNRVTIIIDKKLPSKVVPKKTLVNKKVTKAGITAKNNVKPIQQLPKKTVITNKVVATPISHQIPGKRVALANSNSARANSYTTGEQSLNAPPATVSGPTMYTPSMKTKIKQKVVQEQPSAWGIKYRTYNAVDMNAIENYGPTRDYTIRAWDRLNITYNFNPDWSLSLMPQYYHTWFQDQNRPQSGRNPGLTQTYASYLGDTALILEDKKLASFGGYISREKDGTKKTVEPFVLGGTQAYYAPTSESAQAQGSVGETRTILNLSKSIGKLDLKWTEEFRYYFQQFETNAYLDKDGKPIPNAAYRLLNLLDIGYNFTSKLNFTVETGVVNEYTYGDSYNDASGTYIDYLVMNPDLGYTFNDHFGLDLGIWEVYNYTNPPTISGGRTASYTPFAPYNGTAAGSWAGTEVFLQGTVKF